MALPVDEILNDAVNVIERYIGHEPEVVERLHDILRNARNIKQVIQHVGQTMAPAEAVPATAQVEKRPEAGRPPRAGGGRRRVGSQRRPHATRPVRLRSRNGPRGPRSRADGAPSHAPTT